MPVLGFCLVLMGSFPLIECSRQSELLHNINQLFPVRNFIIFSDSHAVEDWITPFHRSQPVVIVDLTRQRRFENYNTTFRSTLENYLCNYKNVYFTFLLCPEHFAKAFDRIASFNFWKARQINIFVGDFTLQHVRAYSQLAFQKYWATNLVFTNRSFGHLMRYDPFKNSTTTGSNPKLIFKDFASNLHGYQLTIAMVPSITAMWNGRYFNGRDGTLMGEILMQFNASSRFLHFPVAEYGDFSNGSFTGIMALVANGTVDANFNSRFMSREVAKYVDNTFPHEMDNLMIILPFQTSDNSSMWIVESVEILVVSLVVLSLTLLVLLLYSKLSWSRLVIVGAQLMTGRAISWPNSNLTNIVVMSTTFYMFFLLSCFQCRLISVLTIASKDPELSRIKEAANDGFRFNTEKIFKTSLDSYEGSDRQSMAKIMSKNCFYETEELLQKFAQCSNTDAFITTDKTAHVYYEHLKEVQGFRKSCFYNLKERLNPVQLSFVLRYGSPLLGKVNDIVLRTFESGLQGIWSKSLPSQLDVDAAIVIQFENLKAQIYCLVVGWILSLAALLLEIAFQGKRRICVRSQPGQKPCGSR